MLLRTFVLFLMFCGGTYPSKAQECVSTADSSSVITNSFWSNWFGQIGVDMSLQNPYGTNFMNVFPNGKTYGIDVALGKWLSPDYGIRGKINLENFMLHSDHAKWIRNDKGYLILTGDILVNLTNLIGDYHRDKKWNIYVYPRAGAFKALGGEASPVLGVGVGATYRLKGRWSIYSDIAYHVVNSVIGFDTGQGSGSNGYFDINLGVQLDLGENKFYKVSEKTNYSKHDVITNSFWSNWFVQAGVGMSLINRYGTNFANVFPNGKTLGINAAVGKWLSPEVGARVGVNWQNGIIGNNHLTWLDDGIAGSNHKGGGFAAAYLDVFLNIHNIFKGYNPVSRWDPIFFVRAGLDSNLATSSGSPLVGVGTEQTFSLNNRLKLFADIAYQFTAGEFLNIGDGDNGSSGWFDLNVGVQYELGVARGWKKATASGIDYKGYSSPTIIGHNWPRFIVNTGASVVVAFGAKTALKAIVSEERPDHSDNESFPSGHATMAFAAARSIDKEFRKDRIWIPIAGYAAATAIGVERVVNKHHHWYDVVAGAGLGIGAAELTWWLSDLVFAKHNKRVAIGSSGNTLDVAVSW